jgi:hypothetical protein
VTEIRPAWLLPGTHQGMWTMRPSTGVMEEAPETEANEGGDNAQCES